MEPGRGGGNGNEMENRDGGRMEKRGPTDGKRADDERKRIKGKWERGR
jgi:hypothetical protein